MGARSAALDFCFLLAGGAGLRLFGLAMGVGL
jgi:hypothetical protein